MLNKKYVYILMLFIISIFAISSASAENVTDIVATDDAGDIESISDEDLSTIIKSNDDIAANEDDVNEEVLAIPQDDDVLSIDAPFRSYTVDLNDNGYTISGTNGGTITYYLSPCQTMGVNGYNFYFAFFQIDEKENLQLIKKTALISSYSDKTVGNHNYKIAAKFLTPGSYIMVAANNDGDGNILDRAVLKVKGTATITASDYNSKYNSGAVMTVKFTDKDTKAPLKYIQTKVTFSNGETYYPITDAQGQISFVPPVGAGTHSVTFSSNFDHISAAAVKKSIVIQKAPVTVQAAKVVGYKGTNTVFKATVQSEGKNVNEGTVTFKIGSKKLTANVKDGVAKVSIKLYQVKTFEYSATFNGSNYQSPTKSVSTAKINKRAETKIIVKDQVVYRGSNKAFYVVVKTKAGKPVTSGKVKIIDTVKVNKNGKAKFYAGSIDTYIKQVGNTVYFKKSVTKKYKVKYTPTSSAYLPSTTTMKITVKYKCTACGSTKSHSHNGMTFIVK